MFGEVCAPWWDDVTVYLVGGGASLRDFDFMRLRDRGHLVGINQSLFYLPFCCAGISADLRFATERRDDLADFAVHAGKPLFLCLGNRLDLHCVPGAIYLANEDDEPLSTDPARIRRGPTSGHAALNLAVLKRARRIVLLGFDYGLIDGRHHYHDGYPNSWHHIAQDQSWASWATHFNAMAPMIADLGIEVLNASPASAITAFPKVTIEEGLAVKCRQ